MKKKLEKLKKLGMTPRQAMLFLHNISEYWYNKAIEEGPCTKEAYSSFDTLFSKELSKIAIKDKKLFKTK